MIPLTADPRNALELVRQVSEASSGDVSPAAFLERVCSTLSEAFEFDTVTAVQFHSETEEVSDVGAPSAEQASRRPIADAPLLAQALKSRALVLALDGDGGDVASVVALPLISGRRCLGFLVGNRRDMVSPDERELEALATVGVVAAILLDNAFVQREAEQLDVLKSEFIALAAHELRSPLSSIYGLSVTLDERGDELAESDRLELRYTLRAQAERTRHLIEQLLDLSRFDLSAIQVSPKRLRLRPKIEDLVRTLVNARTEAVKITVPPDLEAFVDPIALDRMLSNLIANALRHGAPPVTVTAAQRDTHLRLAVEDRGEGVRSEFVPRLFDRFSRGPESHGRTDGSGLGLAIVQAYAQAHGGDIVYQPAVPHGARFELVIPLRFRERRGAVSAPRLVANPTVARPS
jgi:signal transduction histidine kinase